MLDRARKLWDIVCRPKPKVIFRVIDSEIESVPEMPEDENTIEVLFVT